MKLFLRRLFIAVLPILIFFGAVELFCRTKTLEAKKKANIEQGAATAEVLILGDSHGRCILPNLISRPAVTLALNGKPLAIDYYLLRKYVDRMPKLKVVVLAVCTHRFYADLEPDSWNAHVYRTIFGIDYKTERFDLKNYSMVLAGHRRSTLQFMTYIWLNGKQLYTNKDGAAVADLGGSRFGRLKYDEKRIAATFKMPHQFVSGLDNNRQFLVNILDLCKSRGIRVILVSTPLYPTYLEALPVAAVQAVNSMLANEVRRYHLLHLNYEHPGGFSVQDYWDDDHLNARGSAKFTQILNRDMQVAGALK